MAAFLDIPVRSLARFDIVDSHTAIVINGNIDVIIETIYVDYVESKTQVSSQHLQLSFGIKFSEKNSVESYE